MTDQWPAGRPGLYPEWYESEMAEMPMPDPFAGDVRTRYNFARVPPEPEREAIAEWLTFHGIPRDLVAVPGWIERDPQGCAVRAKVYALAPDGIGRLYDKFDVFTSRNEAPPLAFPRVANWLAFAARTTYGEIVSISVDVLDGPLKIEFGFRP